MNLLTYSLASAAAFSGIIFGVILAYIAPEELKEGQKYFLTLQGTILCIISFLLIDLYNFFIAVISSILVLISFFIINNCIRLKHPKKKLALCLAECAVLIVLFFVASNTGLFAVIACLIFLFGFATGSLLAFDCFKKHISMLKVAFLIISYFLIATVISIAINALFRGA